MVKSTKEINHYLGDRKWEITIHILNVAIMRQCSVQFIRQEIIEQLQISNALLSMLEKTPKSDTKNTLTINVEDKLNDYFSKYLKRNIVLNGNRQLEFS